MGDPQPAGTPCLQLTKNILKKVPCIRYLIKKFFFFLNQQSEYKVFYKLMYCLSGSDEVPSSEEIS